MFINYKLGIEYKYKSLEKKIYYVLICIFIGFKLGVKYKYKFLKKKFIGL